MPKNIEIVYVISISLFVVCSDANYIPDHKIITNNTNIVNASKNLTNYHTGNNERTLILIKPDAIHRGLVGRIIERFERKGFKLIGLKLVWANKELIGRHYEQLNKREFYSRLLRQMVSGPVIPMVFEGLNVVKLGRQLMGSAEPHESMPGTIRGDFSMDVGRTVVHGSHLPEAAEKEIHIWFDEKELVSWTPATSYWLNEQYTF